MNEPILSREEVEALAHRICMKYEHSDYVDMRRYTFGLLTLEQLARAIESAVLERVCGEAQWQYRVRTCGYEGDWINCNPETAKRLQEKQYAESHGVRALYTINRSKS